MVKQNNLVPYRSISLDWTNRNNPVHFWDRGYQNGALWREEREVENPNAKFGNLAHSLTSHSGVLLLKRTLYGR